MEYADVFSYVSREYPHSTEQCLLYPQTQQAQPTSTFPQPSKSQFQCQDLYLDLTTIISYIQKTNIYAFNNLSWIPVKDVICLVDRLIMHIQPEHKLILSVLGNDMQSGLLEAMSGYINGRLSEALSLLNVVVITTPEAKAGDQVSNAINFLTTSRLSKPESICYIWSEDEELLRVLLKVEGSRLFMLSKFNEYSYLKISIDTLKQGLQVIPSIYLKPAIIPPPTNSAYFLLLIGKFNYLYYVASLLINKPDHKLFLDNKITTNIPKGYIRMHPYNASYRPNLTKIKFPNLSPMLKCQYYPGAKSCRVIGKVLLITLNDTTAWEITPILRSFSSKSTSKLDRSCILQLTKEAVEKLRLLDQLLDNRDKYCNNFVPGITSIRDIKALNKMGEFLDSNPDDGILMMEYKVIRKLVSHLINWRLYVPRGLKKSIKFIYKLINEDYVFNNKDEGSLVIETGLNTPTLVNNPQTNINTTNILNSTLSKEARRFNEMHSLCDPNTKAYTIKTSNIKLNLLKQLKAGGDLLLFSLYETEEVSKMIYHISGLLLDEKDGFLNALYEIYSKLFPYLDSWRVELPRELLDSSEYMDRFVELEKDILWYRNELSLRNSATVSHA